jgi:Carbamoylphosphate synthase small subunit
MCVTKKRCTCSLVLEDGTVFTGESFGAKIPVDGEVGKLVLYFFFIFLLKKISILVNYESPWIRGGNVLCV